MATISGIMGFRVGILLLFVFGMTWACDARHLVVSRISDQVARNDDVCTLCEQYVTMAVDYLEENKTQIEIIDALHKRCSRIPSFKQQCDTLVDYYAPLFFLELSSVQPGEFCRKFDLCETVVALASEARQDSCDLCHRAVTEMLIKLKDPDTQLDIIQFLLNACKSMKNYEKKCKRMVFEYGPMILINAEQFLETEDVCVLLRACPATKKTSEAVDIPVLADA